MSGCNFHTAITTIFNKFSPSFEPFTFNVDLVTFPFDIVFSIVTNPVTDVLVHEAVSELCTLLSSDNFHPQKT